MSTVKNLKKARRVRRNFSRGCPVVPGGGEYKDSEIKRNADGGILRGVG